MPKSKKPVKSREELVHDFKRKEEVARKGKIVVDHFYPSLIEATVSIDEAKMLIQSVTSLIMAEVLGTMKEKKFSEIMPSLIEKLCPDNERKEEVTKLLETVKDENIYVAREVIEGMSRAIETMINDEMKDRKLDSLKADWPKMINS